MIRFYVYVVFRPNGTPCYVGKGKGNRWRDHLRGSHNQHLRRIVSAAGGDVPIIVVRSGLQEPVAFDVERALIKAIGRGRSGPLVNLTDGGDGMAGHQFSIESRMKMSRSATGKVQSAETVAKRVAKITGRKRSPAVIEKLRQVNLGRKRSEETKSKMRRPKTEAHRAKLRLAKLGYKQSLEHIEASAATRRGKPRPPEVLEKVRLGLLGKKHTAERRANQRTANRSRDPDVHERIIAATRAAMQRPAVQAKMAADRARKAAVKQGASLCESTSD